MEIKLLKLWIGSLKAHKPDVEPEASHFDGLIEWLENYIEAAEHQLLPERTSVNDYDYYDEDEEIDDEDLDDEELDLLRGRRIVAGVGDEP